MIELMLWRARIGHFSGGRPGRGLRCGGKNDGQRLTCGDVMVFCIVTVMVSFCFLCAFGLNGIASGREGWRDGQEAFGLRWWGSVGPTVGCIEKATLFNAVDGLEVFLCGIGSSTLSVLGRSNQKEIWWGHNMQEPMLCQVCFTNWNIQNFRIKNSHDVESNPGPRINYMSSNDPLTLNIPMNVKNTLRYAYMNLEKSKEQKNFFSACIDNRVIPSGLRLHFNLAQVPETETVLKIQQVLDKASSDLLYILYDQAKKNEFENLKRWTDCRNSVSISHGQSYINRLVGAVRKGCSKILRNTAEVHKHKLDKLKKQKQNQVNQKSCMAENFQGSLKIKAFNLICKTSKDCSGKITEDITNGKQIPGGRRHHRKIRRGKRNKKSHNTEHWSPSEEELKKRDPVVLVENLKLTKEQISVCRLSDKFIPTPKTPINVLDQMIGTYEWAERLRWHQFFYFKNIEEGIDTDTEEFVKFPWYIPSGKKAPMGNKALENFIQKCTQEFLDIKKRKRIKDNLTVNQRLALRDLQKLPFTHNCACRFADKSGLTVITYLPDDDEHICNDLKDPKQFDILPQDNTRDVCLKICQYTDKWVKRGVFKEDIAQFVKNTEHTHPAKCKPLIKIHKPPPFPHRLLLSGSGTPTQNLSKVIHLSINHLTDKLPYQILDTKEFLNKIQTINEDYNPLPSSTVLATCDVVSLYPSVDNEMGIPAVEKMLKKYPSDLKISSKCIIEGLTIALNNNLCSYEDGQGKKVYASPNTGTAMGPPHAPTYVDIFMGCLDEKLVKESPIPLLSSIKTQKDKNKKKDIVNWVNWSRYRDDGFIILPDEKFIPILQKHLETLCPEKIKWTMCSGKSVEYLDVKVTLTDKGKLVTDVFSKNSHSYLPPFSCHPPSVFKGMLIGMGRRLRMICSDDTILHERIEEYAKYLVISGWKYEDAMKGLKEGANVTRKKALRKRSKKKQKKIAWVTTWDPRVPDKSCIIRNNLNLLYKNPDNLKIFPKNSIIAGNRRPKNIGEMYKPSVPKRFLQYGPENEKGFFKCKGKCDICLHSTELTSFNSNWDGRRWYIRSHLQCTTNNVIYMIQCKIHSDFLYVGSTVNLKKRWANHKSDVKLRKNKKCTVAAHVASMKHPVDNNFMFLNIIPIEKVWKVEKLLERELFWQANLGTLSTGGNERKDFASVLKNRIQF